MFAAPGGLCPCNFIPQTLKLGRKKDFTVITVFENPTAQIGSCGSLSSQILSLFWSSSETEV